MSANDTLLGFTPEDTKTDDCTLEKAPATKRGTERWRRRMEVEVVVVGSRSLAYSKIHSMEIRDITNAPTLGRKWLVSTVPVRTIHCSIGIVPLVTVFQERSTGMRLLIFLFVTKILLAPKCNIDGVGISCV